MFKTLTQKLIYENPWMKVWEDEVEFRGGRKGIYAYIEKKDAGPMMVPMTDEGRFMMMREWRYPNKRADWGFPAGGMDGGETMLDAAKRELKEELGYVANEWVDLGTQYIDPGGSQQQTQVFLVRGLRKIGGIAHGDNEIIEEVCTFTLAEIDDMIRNGTIDGQWTLSAIAKVKAHLKKEE